MMKHMRLAFALVGITSAMVLAYGLSLGEMKGYMIVDGFLIGTSLISFTSHRLLERQREMIDGLLLANSALMANNKHMVEVNAAMQAAISAASAAPPPPGTGKPMGRVH